MSTFPKYHELICDTYTPPISSLPAALGTTDLAKSRAYELFLLFRSVETADKYPVNSIRVEIVLDSISVIGDITTYSVVLTLSDGLSNTTVHNFTQAIEDDGEGGVTCIEDGMVQLHAIIDPLPYIEMPVRDNQILIDDGLGGTDPWFAPSHERTCIVPNFGPVFLSGGDGELPDPSTIITGPAYSLYHIDFSEAENIVGDIEHINKIIEWNGSEWEYFPSVQFVPAFDANGNVITPHPDCPNPTPI